MTDSNIIPLNREAAKRSRTSDEVLREFVAQFVDTHKAAFHDNLVALIDAYQHLPLDYIVGQLQGAIVLAQANAEKSKE